MRRGSQGRISDKLSDQHEKYAKLTITLPQDIAERLDKYSIADERAKSWCIQKALNEWLAKRGY